MTFTFTEIGLLLLALVLLVHNRELRKLNDRLNDHERIDRTLNQCLSDLIWINKSSAKAMDELGYQIPMTESVKRWLHRRQSAEQQRPSADNRS